MKVKQYLRLTLTVLAIGLAGMFFSACSKMDSTYDQFIQNGQIIYPGKADSITVHPGRERLTLSWLASSDPKVDRAIIYWNNREDSIEVPLDSYIAGQDTVVVPFDRLTEGSYVFEIYTFDAKGNRSVETEVLGRVYGDIYESQLLSRPIDEAILVDGVPTLFWGAVPDTTAIGSEVVYVDSEGVERTLFVPKSEQKTQLPEFSAPGIVHDRTLYVPHEKALDTFYTDFTSRMIKGPPPPPFFIDKSGWTITASSEDVKGGRTAANLIDGDLGSMFVNELGSGLTYPHSVTVDMGTVVQDIEGFYFYQRSFNQTKTVQVLTSVDGEEWKTQGIFTLESTSGEPVFLELATADSFRYFKHIYIDDYGNSDNVNLMEMGAYTRPIPPVHLDRSKWSITASSEDVAGGRTAPKLIDGDLSTLWVNQLGAGLDYPHTIEVDMGEIIEGIDGFYFYQRGLNNTETVEVLVSEDGQSWESKGQFTIPNIAGDVPVYIEFSEPDSFRYFKHIYLDAYTSSGNINLKEMGTFRRPE